MKQMNLKSKNAFSLVELAIGLAVLTVLILSISMSAGLRDNARVQSAANSVQTLRSAAESYLALGKVNFVGMNVDALKTAKLLPDGFVAAKSNPWGGDFGVSTNAADNTRFDISLGSLGKSEAEKLSNYFSNSATKVAYDEGSTTWTATF